MTVGSGPSGSRRKRRDEPPALLRYAGSIGVVCLAVWLRWMLRENLGDLYPYALPLFAVLVTARFGGLGPALLAVGLGVILCDLFLIPPYGGLALLGGGPESFGAALFVATGLGIAWLGGAMRSGRLLAERREADSRRRAAQIMMSPDAIVTWRLNGEILTWNAGAAKLYGVPEAEALGRPPEAILGPDIASYVSRFGEDGVWQGEVMRTTPDGREIHVEVHARVWSEGDDRIVAEIGRDMSGHRALEEALRDANQRLEELLSERTSDLNRASLSLMESEGKVASLVSSAMDGILTVDGSQTIVSANAEAEKLFGFEAGGLIGLNLDALIPDRFRRYHEQAYQRYEATGETKRKDGDAGLIVGMRADGTEFYLQASLSRVETASGVRCTVTLRDASDRLRTEDELRTYQTQLATALEVGRMGTWSVDLRENSVSWDDANLRIWGRTREELGDGSLERVFSFVHPDDRRMIADLTEETLRHSNQVSVEYRVVCRDGSIRWHRTRGRVDRDEQGIPVRYAGITTDITDQRKEEEARVRSQKLEALGTLAGGIAHDFNNMLAAIKGNAAYAATELEPGHPVQTSLDEIRRAAARASDIVRRIVAFARPDEHELQPVHLQDIVREAVLLARAALPAMVEVRQEYADDLPRVLADPSQIHQVVLNLATNAAHAIQSHGTITVRLEEVAVTRDFAETTAALRTGRYVRLSVQDTGSGIPSGILERVFDPFFTTKDPGVGTGLGLSVVHGIVTSHGGAVTVYSEEGRGTTFHVYLPVAESLATPSPDEEPAAPANGAGQRVLYVDDEEALVSLAQRYLTRMGYAVTGYVQPTEALEAFRAEPAQYDVVVTDLSMPLMTGFELVRKLRDIRADVPVVMLSGYVRDEDARAADDLGVRVFLSKPSSVEELARVLDELFRGGTPPIAP